jgi:hypothetical protein
MTEYYHTREAAASHLKGVGLTFDGFIGWLVLNHALNHFKDISTGYPASLLRQYIKTHHTL